MPLKLLTWIENLYEVGTPIRRQAEAIEEALAAANERMHEAEQAYKFARSQACIANARLEREVAKLWTAEEIAAAKSGTLLVDGTHCEGLAFSEFRLREALGKAASLGDDARRFVAALAPKEPASAAQRVALERCRAAGRLVRRPGGVWTTPSAEKVARYENQPAHFWQHPWQASTATIRGLLRLGLVAPGQLFPSGQPREVLPVAESGVAN